MKKRRVLGLFAKRPTAGQVKTRLAAETSPEWAADAAWAFLRDLLDRLATFDAQRVLAYAPAAEKSFFAPLAAGRYDLVPQTDGDLGRRLAGFFAEQIGKGADQVVVLGTDSPTVPLEFVEQAFAEMDQADVVLGPATDGGYYLIGCGRRLPPLFEGIPWGEPGVLAETVARLADPRWRFTLLPAWYDVDTLADWRRLQEHLTALQRAGVDPGLPHTLALIRGGNVSDEKPSSSKRLY